VYYAVDMLAPKGFLPNLLTQDVTQPQPTRHARVGLMLVGLVVAALLAGCADE
jgi:hypothetical protein